HPGKRRGHGGTPAPWSETIMPATSSRAPGRNANLRGSRHPAVGPQARVANDDGHLRQPPSPGFLPQHGPFTALRHPPGSPPPRPPPSGAAAPPGPPPPPPPLAKPLRPTHPPAPQGRPGRRHHQLFPPADPPALDAPPPGRHRRVRLAGDLIIRPGVPVAQRP